MSALVLSFEDVGRDDLDRVGGKGANLGEMVSAKMPVPPGFCVTTLAFDRFMSVAQQHRPQLTALLDEVESLGAQDVAGVRRVAGAIREELEQAPVDNDIVSAVRDAVNTYASEDAPEVAFAVRSSATLEDLEDASFAGQQDTYLQVVGVDAVIDRMRACWASLFADRAVLYRRMHGYQSRDAKLSVVVQKMARPEISGILFTADPLTGHRGRCSVDASWGLGEALVSGLVNADLYQLEKATGRTLSVHVGDKAIAIVPQANGRGTKTIDLDPEKRTARVLDDTALSALADLGRKVEAHYGGAHQDIEFGFERRRGELSLVLLQARPITSLFPVPEGQVGDGDSGDDELALYASFNHVQNMMDPMSPFGASVIRYAIPFGKSTFVEPSSLIVPAGHHLFMDLSPALRTFPFSKAVPLALSAADSTMAAIIRDVVARPAFKRRRGKRKVRRGWVIKNILSRVFWRAAKNVLRKDLATARTAFVSHMEAGIASRRSAIEAEATLLGRMKAAQQTFGHIFDILIPVFPPAVIAGGLSWRLLTKMCRGQIPAEEVQELTRGFEGNVTTQMDLELGDLADVVRGAPALKAVFDDIDLKQFDVHQTLDEMQRLDVEREFFRGWEVFISRYGHRCPGEIDAGRVRWREDPTSLLVSIKGMLASDVVGKHREQETAARMQAEAMGKRISDTLGRGWLGFVRGPIARRLVKNVRTYLALREHGKFFALQLIDIGRNVALEAGTHFVAQGRLEDARDVFYFSVDELVESLEDTAVELKGRVELRTASMAAAQSRTPPRVLTSEGEAPPPPKRTDLPPGALGGIAASAGTVEGIAKVVMDPTEEVLHDGEVLIAPFTDPGWTPLFVHAAGLVMEVGGLMTHGSVVAREYGIPAVVGVDGATKHIKTGDRIIIDGTSGIVTFAETDADSTSADDEMQK